MKTSRFSVSTLQCCEAPSCGNLICQIGCKIKMCASSRTGWSHKPFCPEASAESERVQTLSTRVNSVTSVQVCWQSKKNPKPPRPNPLPTPVKKKKN